MRSPEGFHRNMLEHIGLIYRNALENCAIYVNGTEAVPIDPLFLMPNCRFFDVGNGILAENTGEKEYQFKSSDNLEGRVKIRCSYLPYGFQRDNIGKQIKQRIKIMKENNHSVFIVTRAGRQIDTISKSEFPVDLDNITPLTYDRNWAVEIDFEPALDEEFGITVNKQQVTISERMWEMLANQGLSTIVKGLKTRYNNEAKKPKENEKSKEKSSEKIVKIAQDEGLLKKSSEIPPEKEEAAKEKVKKEAEEIAEKIDRPKEEIQGELEYKITEKPYELNFKSIDGGNFYTVEQFGPQLKLYINTAHRFYTDVYTEIKDSRIKTAIELLIFVLGSTELQSTGKKNIFYQQEKIDWSKKLNSLLALLDQYEALDEKIEAEEEQN